jgi:hypothetical protein
MLKVLLICLFTFVLSNKLFIISYADKECKQPIKYLKYTVSMCHKSGPSTNFPFRKIETFFTTIQVKICRDSLCEDCMIQSRVQENSCNQRLGTVEKYVIQDFISPPPFKPNAEFYLYSIVIFMI